MFLESAQRVAGISSATNSDRSQTRQGDRRSRPRSGVRWPVLIFQDSGPDAIESVTENLSSAGFFCFSKIGLTSGELTTCTLHIPKHARGHQQVLTLLCRAKVVRVEPTPIDGKVGIAFHIENYCCCSTVPQLGSPQALSTPREYLGRTRTTN